MVGKSLSLWTMCWFASAMAFLLSALFLALTADLGPGRFDDPLALAIIHLFTLGWLTQIMLGALIQFAPVLASRPLVWPALALPSLVTCSGGALALAIGFLGLDGHAAAQPLFLMGPVLLGLSFMMVAAMILATVITRLNLRLPEVRMLLLALVGLATLWLTGAAMTSTLAGQNLAVDLSNALGLHILAGAGGFLSVAAFGVSYKLFAMFLLAPEGRNRARDTIFGLAGLTALLLLVGLVALTQAGQTTALSLIIAVLSLTAGGYYLGDMIRLWHARRRVIPDLNMSWSRAALFFLALTLLLLPFAVYRGGNVGEAAVFMALVGWLSTLTLAQLIRITSFLTWIQIFAPRIGRQKIPMVSDLSGTTCPTAALAVWSLSALGGGLSLLVGNAIGFRVALCGLLGAAIVITCELVAIRRLWHLPQSMRPAHLPPLVLPILTPQPVAETRYDKAHPL